MLLPRLSLSSFRLPGGGGDLLFPKAAAGGRRRELILVANKIDLRPGGTGLAEPLLADAGRAVRGSLTFLTRFSFCFA
jgi:hypothetical protein